MDLTAQIRQKAIDLGFDLTGITDAEPLPLDYLNNLLAWLDAGYSGKMTWMHRNLEKRIDPAKLLPGAKSVIVVGLNYKPALEMRGSSHERRATAFGKVAAYAHYEDYHPFIKKQLRLLVDFVIVKVGAGFKFQMCVDSAPLLERALAVKAGLGFIGKNHMLTNPQFGSQIFLGEIITNLDLEKSAISNQQSAIGTCRSCGNCVSACPTGALRPDGWFDATKCISYLTIEAEGEIQPEVASKIGNRLFGCCECVIACPYHQKAPSCANKQFAFYPDRAELNLQEVMDLTEAQFQIRFADSPIQRTGLARLKRTAEICLKNLSPE